MSTNGCRSSTARLREVLNDLGQAPVADGSVRPAELPIPVPAFVARAPPFTHRGWPYAQSGFRHTRGFRVTRHRLHFLPTPPLTIQACADSTKRPPELPGSVVAYFKSLDRYAGWLSTGRSPSSRGGLFRRPPAMVAIWLLL